MANPFLKLFNSIGILTAAQADAQAIQKIKSGHYADIINEDLKGTWSDKVPFTDNVAAYAEQYRDEIYVYAPVYLISNTIAGLPLKIYRDIKSNGNVTAKEIPNHPALSLLKNPNEDQSGHDLLESLAANMLLTGMGYLLADKPNKPSEIYSLNSSKTVILHKKGSGKKVDGYKYGDIAIEPELITMFSFFNPTSDYYGLSPLAAARYAIDTVENARISNRNIYKNGCRIGATLESEQTIGEEAYQRLKKEFEQRYQGSEKAHKVAILEQGLKYKDIGINPKDMDFIQGMKLGRQDVCAAFLVPSILIGDFENASYNNILEAKKIYWQNCIIPKLDNIETKLNSIVHQFDKTAYCKFDISDVEPLQADIKGKVEMAERLWRMGVPLNTTISMLGLPLDPIPGGDVAYLPISVVAQGQPSAAAGEAQPQPSADEGKGQKAAAAAPAHKLKKIAWTEERLTAKWKAFASVVDTHEKKYIKDLKPFFRGQEARVLANLGKLKSIAYAQLSEKVFVFYTEDTIINAKGESQVVKKAINIDAILFDYDDEVAGLYEVSLPNHTAALKAQADSELQALEISASFNVDNPKVVEWLEDNALDKAKFVISSKRDELKASLIEGVNAGESIDKLKERVREYYKLVEDYQVERVARTEVVGASNEGALMAYDQEGIKKKGWLAAIDERTRETHLAAYEKYQDGIPLDEDFHVGADTMDAPGNGSLPEENIQCRCSIIPILED